MTLYPSMYHLEAAEPLTLARFYSELLQIPLDDGAGEDLAMIDAGHQHSPMTWIFQRADAANPPARRLTLDLTDDHDWQAEVERARSIGATLLAEQEVGGVRWAELTDPEDNLFRVFAPRPT